MKTGGDWVTAVVGFLIDVGWKLKTGGGWFKMSGNWLRAGEGWLNIARWLNTCGG